MMITVIEETTVLIEAATTTGQVSVTVKVIDRGTGTTTGVVTPGTDTATVTTTGTAAE